VAPPEDAVLRRLQAGSCQDGGCNVALKKPRFCWAKGFAKPGEVEEAPAGRDAAAGVGSKGSHPTPGKYASTPRVGVVSGDYEGALRYSRARRRVLRLAGREAYRHPGGDAVEPQQESHGSREVLTVAGTSVQKGKRRTVTGGHW